MQTYQTSASSPASLAKTLACFFCILGLIQMRAAAAEPAPLTTAELEALMLPPVGWKVDEEVLRRHLWTVADADGDDQREVVYPFWPAFVMLQCHDDGSISLRNPGYDGTLGHLLTDALDSPDPARKKKAELWLRHSLILYFTGFRLSKFLVEPASQHRPYAPWIRPEDARRLDQVADRYLAQQKILMHNSMPLEEVSERELSQWLSSPGGTTLSAIYGYFDAVGATHNSVRLNFVYPINWTWSRNWGNQTFTPTPGFGEDLMGLYTAYLIGSEVPDSPAPVSLWLRDVYLSYIAGKELFESKLLPATNGEDGPRVREAVRLWWRHIEKQK